MNRLTVDLGAGTTPILRAGFANLLIFFMALAVSMAWLSVVEHGVDPWVAGLLATCFCGVVGYRYARVACWYELSSSGLTVRTPFATKRHRPEDLTDVRMHERPLSGGGFISVAIRGRRRPRRYLVFGVDLDFGTMIWHFNEAAKDMLAEGARRSDTGGST